MGYKYQKLEFRKLYGTRCMLCGEELEYEETTWHHIIPKSEGGSNKFENGANLCWRCHCGKLHTHKYGSKEYENYTQQIFSNMEKSKL